MSTSGCWLMQWRTSASACNNCSSRRSPSPIRRSLGSGGGGGGWYATPAAPAGGPRHPPSLVPWGVGMGGEGIAWVHQRSGMPQGLSHLHRCAKQQNLTG